jgi:hypothetical protein
VEDGAATMASEVFALTDEQIVGLEAQEDRAERPTSDPSQLRASGGRYKGEESTAGGREDGVDQNRSLPLSGLAKDGPLDEERSAQALPMSGQAGVPVPQEVPQWLAERMKDPWCGDEAREFWDGKQRAEREATAYRELFATPEDARALKEI